MRRCAAHGGNDPTVLLRSPREAPWRVVLHKRTPFFKEEREGFLDGLGGVAAIDILEIVEDHVQLYIASMARRDGAIDEDNCPVRRAR